MADETESVVTVVGLLLACASAFFNGTFPMLDKLCKEEPDPIIFNSMLCVGVFFSSLVVIPFFPLITEAGQDFPLGWSWPGALAGVLLVMATLFSFISIHFTGLATGSATWSCSAIVVAFLWGAVGPAGIQQQMSSKAASVLAIATLVFGALVLNLRSQGAKCLARRQEERSGKIQAAPMLEDGDTSQHSSSVKKSIAGLFCALTVGLFGGSILVPAHYVRPELQGLPLLPSFGCGAGVVGTLVGFVYWTVVKREPLSMRHGSSLSKALRREVIINGIISGFVWNVSNVCQVLAMNHWHMPYGISYPILQCGLVVSGVWGIYYFKESQVRSEKVIFWIGAAILMIGVLLLGVYGPGTYKPQDIR